MRCKMPRGALRAGYKVGGKAMTAYSWNTATSGDWATAGLWTPSGPPNAVTADATIAVAGTYDVTIGATEAFSVELADDVGRECNLVAARYADAWWCDPDTEPGCRHDRGERPDLGRHRGGRRGHVGYGCQPHLCRRVQRQQGLSDSSQRLDADADRRRGLRHHQRVRPDHFRARHAHHHGRHHAGDAGRGLWRSVSRGRCYLDQQRHRHHRR